MNTLEARRRLLGRNVYKRTTEGNPAIAQGSLARMYPRITMQGWTEQAQYEGKNLFSIDDFDSNNKATIQNGTILFNQSLGTVTYNLNLGPGAYSISIARDGFSGINIKINEVVVINNGSSNNYTNNFDVSDGDSVVLEFSEGQNPNGENRMIYDIMLNAGSTVLTYEPYTGRQPSPSPDYPQEITSAGKYNEGTGKYEYEITIANAQTDPDKNQTVALTADRPLTKWDRLEKRNGQWGWMYKSAEIVFDGSEDELWFEYAANDGYYTAISASVYNDFSVEGYAFSDKFLFVNIFSYEHPSIISPSKYYYFLNVKRYGETLSDWRTYLQANPVTILYETEPETFVPLSASEQEQMNELHTFRPTTVLSNDCDCNMSLTYKTKKILEVTT